MHRGGSFIYNIAKPNENCVTEALCNLMRPSYLRHIILRNIGIDTKYVEQISYDQIDTQTNLENVGRPDITIENEECLIYIENKIRPETMVQKSQTTDYLQDLRQSPQEYKKLIFLLPSDYQNEEIDALRKANPDIVSVCDWKDLLKILHDQEFDLCQQTVHELIKFLELTILGYGEGYRLSAKEVAIMYSFEDLVNANSMIYKVYQFTEDSCESVCKGVDSRFSPGGGQMNRYGVGKYITFKETTGSLYYGLTFFEERELGDFVLSFAIHEAIVNAEKLSLDDLGYKKGDEGWYYKKLSKYILTEENATEELAQEIVKYLIEVFGKKGRK